MTDQEKVEQAVAWFIRQDEKTQKIAVSELFNYAVESDWINVTSPKEIEELNEEYFDIESLEAPYFRTCGAPMGLEE